MRQIVLDTETTGLQTQTGHRIIEIGCVELINRKLTKRTFHQYINPERDIDEGAVAVHGLTADFLQDKPIFKQVAKEFMDFIQDAELIIHNAPFDVGFINHELNLLQQSWQPVTHYCSIVDTLVIARKLHVGQPNNLDALCKRYGVDNTKREFHGALLDAHLLAHVYLAMTGGQSSLFDMTSTQKTTEANQTTATSHQRRRTLDQALPVIMATEDELTEHQERLKAIQSKGKCMWLR